MIFRVLKRRPKTDKEYMCIHLLLLFLSRLPVITQHLFLYSRSRELPVISGHAHTQNAHTWWLLAENVGCHPARKSQTLLGYWKCFVFVVSGWRNKFSYIRCQPHYIFGFWSLLYFEMTTNTGLVGRCSIPDNLSQSRRIKIKAFFLLFRFLFYLFSFCFADWFHAPSVFPCGLQSRRRSSWLFLPLGTVSIFDSFVIWYLYLNVMCVCVDRRIALGLDHFFFLGFCLISFSETRRRNWRGRKISVNSPQRHKSHNCRIVFKLHL